ncbi:hypothetical protein HY493_04725 [Candidatus Woesearchaeota archaeon]|nr:hypothetical protein [Candidatus Woesearchaeota archaeon]
MNLGIWVSGRLNGQALINWAEGNKHAVKVLLSMEQKEQPLVWATANIDALKKASDAGKIDLLFKTVKPSGDENYKALDALLAFAKDKYKIDAVAVDPMPAVAHPIRNAARKLKLKTILLPK